MKRILKILRTALKSQKTFKEKLSTFELSKNYLYLKKTKNY